MDKELAFIHLSDIHFNKFSGDQYDLDEDLRNEVVRDIKENALKTIGSPTRILVCGDIAFAGKEKEYEQAKKFLNEVCKIVGIDETFILCVPGNHDVDQDVPKGDVLIDTIQTSIEEAPDINKKLGDCLRSDTAKSALFTPIHQYNQFAGQFCCHIKLDPENPTWQEDFRLNDGSNLRIHGLNSTIISSHRDKGDRLMVLGAYQVPRSQEGVTPIILCHHPPECWKDADGVTSQLNARARVQLYGHKHSQRINKINDALVINSGAMHPSRAEKSWKPYYNWLVFSIVRKSNERFLKVKIYPRILKDDNSCFIADHNNCNGQNYVEHLLKLDPWEGDIIQKDKEVQVELDSPEERIIVSEDKKVVNPFKILTYRFLGLSFVKRSLILSELDLMEEDDEGVDHVNFLDKILQKAKDKKVLDTMWDKINSIYVDGKYTDNPFKKG